MAEIIETTRGLPNTDALTGKEIKGGKGFARNEDEAGAGLIFQSEANLRKYFKMPEPEPTKMPEPEPAKAPEK